MIADLIDQLNACIMSEPYKLSEKPDWIARYLDHQPVVQAMGEVDQPVYNVPATAALYVDQRILRLEDHGKWASIFMKLSAEAPVLSTPAGHSIIHLVKSPTPLDLVVYDVAGYPIVGDVPGRMSLINKRSIRVFEEETLVIPSTAIATSLRGRLSEARFLRFSHMEAPPIIASFDVETLKLQTTSFSSQAPTGRHFFATVLQEALLGSLEDGAIRLDGEDMEALRCFASDRLQDDSHLVTKWKIAKIAAQICPREARDFFRRVEGSNLPNAAALATRIITR